MVATVRRCLVRLLPIRELILVCDFKPPMDAVFSRFRLSISEYEKYYRV